MVSKVVGHHIFLCCVAYYLYSTVIDSMLEWLEPAGVNTMRDLHSPVYSATDVVAKVVVLKVSLSFALRSIW